MAENVEPHEHTMFPTSSKHCSSPYLKWASGTIAVLSLPMLRFIFVSKGFSETVVTRCWRTRSNQFASCSHSVLKSRQNVSSQPQFPEQCVNSSVWSGYWDLNPNISKPGSKNPADIDMAQRYHSDVDMVCNMTDILKLSVNEVISGHVNDSIELSVIDRLKGLRGQTLLQIGTSVDNRNLRFGCPVFGVNRKIISDGGVSISTCEIPLIDFTLAYAFNDALTMAHTPIENQEDHLKKIDELLATAVGSSPRYILLSGIEWDFKWYKDHQQSIDWNYTYSVLEEKMNLFRLHYSEAIAIFLRTQPFLIGSQGSLASEQDFDKYNDLFRKVVENQRPINQCSAVRLADLKKLVMYNGTSGWSDGVHPAGWVSMQFLNILLNVISFLGDHCSK